MYTGFRLPPKYMTLNDLYARFKVIDSSNAVKMYTGFRLPPKYMTLNDLYARFKVIDSSNAVKMAKYSFDSNAM